MSLNRLDKTKMLPSGMSVDLNHSWMAACFEFWLCCFHISIICFIWRQTVAWFRWDGWGKCAVELPTVGINFSSGRRTQSHWKISRSALSPFLTKKTRKSSVMAPAYCKASSYQWHGGGWSQCTTTWLHLHDHLRCKITGWAPRDGLNASLPLFLLCHPLRCLMFAADSIITAVWEGIKRYVARSISHLLNIQLHCTGQDDSAGLTGHWNQSQSAWISSFRLEMFKEEDRGVQKEVHHFYSSVLWLHPGPVNPVSHPHHTMHPPTHTHKKKKDKGNIQIEHVHFILKTC